MSGFSYLILVLALYVGIASAQQKCNPNDEQFCVGPNAACANGECSCNANFVGDPFLACHPAGSRTCKILNDPRGRNWANDPEVKGIDIPVPCKYKLADLQTTEKPNNAGTPYSCSIQVYGAEERLRGKFYESGFEAVIAYTKNVGLPSESTGGYKFRVHIERVNDTLYLESQHRLDKPFKDGVNENKLEQAFGDSTIFVEDSLGVILSIPACGFEAFFRPAERPQVGQPNTQNYRPGVSLSVNEGTKNVQYWSLDNAFCLTPNRDVLNIGDVSESLSLDTDEAFTYRALAGNFVQDFPGTPRSRCEMVSQTAYNCSDQEDRQAAFQECFFMLSEPKFVSCYLEGTNDTGELVFLMDWCLKAYCQEDSEACEKAQTKVSNRECSHLAKASFVGFNCNFNPSPTG